MPHCTLLPGAAQAPARATGPPPSAIPSPGQMRSIASGKLCRTALCSRGRRKRLPGLQVHCRLPYRRPDRCAASPPGNYAALRSAPGGGASACPGYRSTAVCHTVARTDAQHRSGKLCRTALCSRGRRKRLPGLQVHRRLRTRRPGKGRNQISGVFLKPISISIGSCCAPAGSK